MKSILVFIAVAIALPFIAIGSVLIGMLLALISFLLLVTVVIQAVDHQYRIRVRPHGYDPAHSNQRIRP